LVNSLALKIAGIDKNTKVGPGGEIVHDEAGEPTGILKGKAIALVRRFVPTIATEDKLAVAETASNYAASLGITSIQDVHSDDNTEIFRELLRQGKFKTRVYDCTPLRQWREVARANITRATGDAFIRTGCLKHFSDGDFAILPELTKEFIAADKADLQITVHAIGSRANEIILTAFENVIKANGPKDRRLMIEHAHNFRPEDLPRFARSNIIASMQPHLFYGGEPYASLLKTKAVIAFGSDAPIADLNPLYGIDDAVNRGSISEKISVEEAVYAYTMGSAYAEFQENVKGSITVGKLADLIILSDDIFTISSEKIEDTKVLTTIVDGKVVFERK
jgi:predicted amidohydrolase YtcJ